MTRRRLVVRIGGVRADRDVRSVIGGQVMRVKLIENPSHQLVLGDWMPRVRASSRERQRFAGYRRHLLRRALV